MHILNEVFTCASRGVETTKMFWFYLLLGFLVRSLSNLWHDRFSLLTHNKTASNNGKKIRHSIDILAKYINIKLRFWISLSL